LRIAVLHGGAVAELMIVDDARLPQNCENENRTAGKTWDLALLSDDYLCSPSSLSVLASLVLVLKTWILNPRPGIHCHSRCVIYVLQMPIPVWKLTC